MNVEMGSPVIILPRNTNSSALIVADLGHLRVNNCISHSYNDGATSNQNFLNDPSPNILLKEFSIDETCSNCVLDCIKIEILDMDLYSAIRIDDDSSRLGFVHDGRRYLKDKCVLHLKVIRNLDCNTRHDGKYLHIIFSNRNCLMKIFSTSVPENFVSGSLSTAHFILDKMQFNLLMGVMNENLSASTDSANVTMNIPQPEGQQSVLKVIC